MPRKVVLVGIVAILFFWAFPAGGEPPPRPPDLAVGIIPFKRTEAVLNCHIEQRINYLLEFHGVRVALINASIEVPAAFASHPNLDFVVTGAVAGGETPTVFAKVFARGNTSPRTENGACDAVAGSVARKVTDNHAAGNVLKSHEADAKAKLATNPDDFSSLMTLGLLNLYESRWTEAFPFIEHAVKIKPGDLQAQLNLALCYKQRNDHGNWLLHLSNAEKINPDEEGVLIALGNYYAHTGDRQRAVSYYERAKKSALNTDVAHWNLTVVYSEMQNIDLALSNLAAIPATSLYYTEAQPWAVKLAEEKRLIDMAKQKEAAPRKSLWSIIGLPNELAIFFVSVGLVFCLIPYFGGKKFFNFDVPQASPRLGNALKWLGPIAFLAVIAMFPPIWRDTTTSMPDLPVSVAPSVIEADRSASTVGYLK